MKIRKARIPEAPTIAEMVNQYAAQGLMLPKSVLAIYEQIREFTVAEDDEGMIIGCGALRIMWHDLAEVRSLAIRPEAQGKGIGKQIVESLLEEARILRLPRVFALTYQVPFFEKIGFHITPRNVFPQKVWLDCKRCAKKDCCDEIAMIVILDESHLEMGDRITERRRDARDRRHGDRRRPADPPHPSHPIHPYPHTSDPQSSQ